MHSKKLFLKNVSTILIHSQFNYHTLPVTHFKYFMKIRLNIVQRRMTNFNYILHTIDDELCTVYVNCVLHKMNCVLYIMNCVLFMMKCVLYMMNCVCILCLMNCVLYIMNCVLYMMNCVCVLYIMKCVLYKMNCVLYIINCVELCTVFDELCTVYDELQCTV